MNIQNLVLDINKKPFQTITANKGEVGSRFIRITIVDNSTPVDLTGVTVSLYAKKPDGKKVFNSVTVEDKANGVVLAELTSQILSVSGLVRLTLLLVKNGSKLASKQFLVNVDESIVDDEAIESTNEFTALVDALGRVNNIDSRFAKVSSQLEQVANKGTTVEVLERVTKEEVDRQVKDGTIANLTIADNGVSLENLNIEDIDNIRFDMYRKVSTSTNEHILYPTYIYENTQVTNGEETQDIVFRYIFYTECDIEFKLGFKLFSNNNNDGSLTGGQSLAQGTGTTSIIAKKGFTTCEFKLSGVLMKYRYHKLLPWIRCTPSSVGSNIDFSLCSVEYKSNAFNLVSKSSYGQLIELGMDKINPKQIINAGMLPTVMDLHSNEFDKFIEKYNTKNFIELHCPNFAFNAGSSNINYPVVTMPLSFRNILEPYEYEIPVGTKFEYTVISDMTKGKLNNVGLQIFMSDNPNDGSFNGSYGYRSFERRTVTSNIYKYECESKKALPIIEGKYVKFFFDVVVDTTNGTEGLLKYIGIKFTLPNGEEIFLNPQHIYFAKATDGNLPYIYTSPLKPLLITDYYNIEEHISNEIEIVRKEIANAKRVPSKWNGKKYISVGDSITWQHGATNYLPNNEPLKGYQYYVIERLGCEFVNKGISGMTMADTPRWTNTFMTKYKNITWSDFDLVTIALGTNDFGMGSELGNIDSEDTTTFYGAYNTVLNYIFTTNPKIRVVLITPWQRNNRNTPNAENKILLDYVEAIKLLGEKWSCPVYDAYSNAGWNEKTLNIYTVDGLHGSAEGFKFMGESFAEFMALQ